MQSILTKKDIFRIAREQLSIDYNCNPNDFLNDGTIFTEAKIQNGRRELPFGNPRCEIITMGHGVIVNASKDILPFVKKKLLGKSKYEVMTAPFIYGVNPYFLPDLDHIEPIELNKGFTIKIVEQTEIHNFYNHKNFSNALQYNEKSLRPEALGIIVFNGTDIAGIACASADSETMWQLGVDVSYKYRRQGLATAMVNKLTLEILNRGIVPYYTTDCSNIASQKTAIAAGYTLAWSHSFKHRLNGKALSFINYIRYQ